MGSPGRIPTRPRKRCVPTWCQRWSGWRRLSTAGARPMRPAGSRRRAALSNSRTSPHRPSHETPHGGDPMPELPRQVLFGAAYYHEYQTTDRLKTDLDLMLDANFTVIRVGESVWSTWEPDNGVFDLEWLAPVLDEAHARGIAVI